MGKPFALSPAFCSKSSKTDPKRNSPSQGIEHSLLFEPTSPDHFLIHRALLAEFDRAAALADNFKPSVEASLRKEAAFFSVGMDANNASLGVLSRIWSSNCSSQTERDLATQEAAILGLKLAAAASQAFLRKVSCFFSSGSCKVPPSSKGKADFFDTLAMETSNLGGLDQEAVFFLVKGVSPFQRLRGKNTLIWVFPLPIY